MPSARSQRWTQSEQDRIRATSFGAVAADYVRARPDYPLEAAIWMTGDSPIRVLDVGAGTGKFTSVLGRVGHDVVACEPLREMAAAITEAVPNAAVARGRAEKLPFAAGSFEAVTSAQAFHWFDPTKALAEMARVLQLGGVATLVWNLRDESVGWVKEMSSIIGSEELELDDPWHQAFTAAESFGPLARATFSYAQSLTLDDLLALVRSRSVWATSSPPDQKEMLDRITRLVQETGSLDPGAIELPYKTYAFKAERRR
jgi:SAM-dependent methyltransferase